MEYVHDRVATTATAFMGLTMECARCHDHKYDPLSQKEYYQMASFFNQVDDLGLTGDDGNAGPNLLIPSPKDKERLASLKKEISGKKQQLTLSERELAEQVDFISQLKKESYSLKKDADIYLPFDKIKNDKLDDHKEVSVAKGVEIVSGERENVVELDEEYEFMTVKNQGIFEQNQPFSGAIWINPKTQRTSQTIVGNSGPKGNVLAWVGFEFWIV